MAHLTISEVIERSKHGADWLLMKANAELEQACLAQAKAELGDTANSGIDFCCKILRRAQEIKRERSE